MTAETEASKSGIIEAKARSRLKISTAKITAAIGALNIEATAPAEAQPINKVLFLALV